MKQGLLAFIGLSSGIITAAALYAIVATIGVLSRLSQMTRTARFMRWYGSCFMAGCILGNVTYIFEIPLKAVSAFGIGVTGLFMGIYLGCFIGALSEVLQIFPIVFRRLHVKVGTKPFLIGMAGGKIVGALLDFFV